jgi:hypothetical protein
MLTFVVKRRTQPGVLGRLDGDPQTNCHGRAICKEIFPMKATRPMKEVP